jgi:MinD superfamily P-loop ATPase
MGSVKDAELERMGKEEARMSAKDWPRCDRCSDPIDYDLVQLEDDKPVDWPGLCSYCEHMCGGGA